MECIKQPLTVYEKQLTKACQTLFIPLDEVCFFDIETTGLSPNVSSLYLIGIIFHEDGHWQLLQWFADDYVSEADLLRSFADYTAHFTTYINYNGSSFDISYLEKKYAAHQIPSPFATHKNLDIYRQIRHKKKYFPVPNMKLTTMEQLLHFRRHDNYSGKDCIRLYTDFMQRKYARDCSMMITLKEKILLHNKEDLIGTALCSQLLAYDYYKPHNPTWKIEGETLFLTDSLPFFVPLPLSCEKDIFSLDYNDNILTVSVPLWRGTLYHYFTDYKNYYYLPSEDMAVHKSVGIYVDSAHRRKATATNCYIKKEGLFLPLPIGFTIEHIPFFQETKKQKRHYIVCDDTIDTICDDYLCYIITNT